MRLDSNTVTGRRRLPALTGLLIGLFVAGITSVARASAPIIERGSFSTGQASRDQWHVVTFKQQFSKIPVVILGPATFRGADPLTLIVKDVTKSGFKYQIREWEYLANGNHIKETFAYLALEPGMHSVDGQLWEAGRRDFPNPGWKAVSTQSPFTAPPIVLTQPIAETSTVARVKEVTAQGFKISLQTEESLPNTDATPARCGWLVISKGLGIEGGLRSLAGSTGPQVNHLWKSVDFASSRGARPGIFAGTQSFIGPDPVSLRFRNFRENGVDFRLQEEKSKDAELTHVKEEVGYLVLSDIQPRSIETSRLEVAEVQTGKAWATVNFQQEHLHPVVIPGLLGFNGSEPAIPRISQVTPQGCKVQVAEWDYLDQAHARETIPYLVIEEGVYSAGNGIWEAGRTFVDGKSWKKVRFRSDQFGIDPIVMVGQTTVKDPSKVTIRLRNVTQTGFEARLYRQESDKAVQHGRETIHFLAVDQAVGNLSNVADFKTWRKEDANNLWKGVALPTFADLPFVFGSTQTTQGIDPIGVRARNHTVSSFELKLQEESSADSERGHVHEVVAGLALGVFSLEDSDGDGLSDAEELYGQEVIYTVEVEVPVLDPVTGQETGATETITQTHMDWVYTDPNDDDSDGDGLPDGFEFNYGLNPRYSADGERDTDGDGISDGDEYVAMTHELSWFTDSTDDGSGETGGDDTSGGSNGEDTSGGGSGDDGGTGSGDPPAELIRPPVDPLEAWMERFGFDPNDTGVLTSDTDGDSLSNEEEYEEGLNPLMADTDFDGYTDSEEIDAGSDPLDGTDYVSDLPVEDDGDRDGMLDSWESLHGLDPTDERDAVRDFDYDRLPSIVEFQLGTNPVVGTQNTEINRVEGWKSELTLPSSGRLPNEATVTFNDLGEWFSLDENGQGEIIVKRWSEALWFEEIGELGEANVRYLYSIAANNFSTVAAWVVTDLDDYELRVSSVEGDSEVVLSGPLTGFRPVGKLEITDAGFVVGAYEDANGDDYAFRWRSGVLEVAGIQSANNGILGVSEIGEVLTEFGGIVLPRGREDHSDTEIYRSISKFGEIGSSTWSSSSPFGYYGSVQERSTDYFTNSLGDSFSYFDVRFHSGSDYSWLVRPGRHASFTIEGEQWKLDGRQAFDVSRDDHVLQSGSTDSSDYSESEDYSDWDSSYLGSSSDPYVFPEKDAALLALDFNEYRDVVGFIYFDAEDYYSDGSSASVEAGFHFQYPHRDYKLGDSRFWRINDGGEIISSRTFEKYWEHTDDETGEYSDGYYLTTEWYLRSPDNDINQNRLPDDWETFWGITDSADDLDGDGLTAFQEYAFNTNPHLADSDGDGVRDDIEIQLGLNPRSADAEALDSDIDGDGLPLWKELELGTNVHSGDSDQDGLSDREEWEVWGSNPLNADHDGDGIPDGVEVLDGSNPVGDGGDGGDGDELAIETRNLIFGLSERPATEVLSHEWRTFVHGFRSIGDELQVHTDQEVFQGRPTALSYLDSVSFASNSTWSGESDSHYWGWRQAPLDGPTPLARAEHSVLANPSYPGYFPPYDGVSYGQTVEVRLVNKQAGDGGDYVNTEAEVKRQFLVVERSAELLNQFGYQIKPDTEVVESVEVLELGISIGKSKSVENGEAPIGDNILRVEHQLDRRVWKDLLPVAIVTPKEDSTSTGYVADDMVAATNLKIAKMEKSLDDQGSLDAAKDIDRFYLRIPGVANSNLGAVSVKVTTVENPDNTYNETATVMNLTADGDDLVSGPMILVSDTVDDNHDQNDNADDDPTHLAQIGGKFRIESITIDGKESSSQIDLEIKEEKTVTINAVVFSDSGITTEEAEDLIETQVRERYAQVGLKIEVGSVEEKNPPYIPNRETDSSEIAIYESEELFGKYAEHGFWAVMAGRSADTPEDPKIFVFFCKKIFKYRVPSIPQLPQEFNGYAWHTGKMPNFPPYYLTEPYNESGRRDVSMPAFANNCFISVSLVKDKPFTLAHEIGHLLTQAGHFEAYPPGSGASDGKKFQNLMRGEGAWGSGTSVTNSLDASKRIQQSQQNRINAHPAVKESE